MVEIKLVKLDIMLLHKQQGRNQSSFSYKIHNKSTYSASCHKYGHRVFLMGYVLKRNKIVEIL